MLYGHQQSGQEALAPKEAFEIYGHDGVRESLCLSLIQDDSCQSGSGLYQYWMKPIWL